MLLLHNNNTATAKGSTSTPATTPAGVGSSPPQIINAINMVSTGALPAGYATYSQPAAVNEKAGFSLAAPTTWKETNSGNTYGRFSYDNPIEGGNKAGLPTPFDGGGGARFQITAMSSPVAPSAPVADNFTYSNPSITCVVFLNCLGLRPDCTQYQAKQVLPVEIHVTQVTRQYPASPIHRLLFLLH